MSRYYFTHSCGLATGGDTSNLLANEELSIVVEGMFFSANQQSSVSGPVVVTVKGLRGASETSSPEIDPGFAYNPSTTQVVNTYFPVQGRTNVGTGVSFTLIATSTDQANGQLTVWGYYTDEQP